MKIHLVPRLLAACLTFFLVTSADARQFSANLSGPSLGYVWDAGEGKLRPLLGIVGNALIGEPVDLGFGITNAVALDGRHFLAATDADDVLRFIDLETNPISITKLDAPAGFSLAAGSRRALAAALYDPDQRSIVVVTGLPSRPGVAHRIDVSALGGPLTQIAIGDDGNSLVFALSDAERDSLYGWTPASGYRVLTVAESVSGVALAPNGDAIVADSKANEIFAIIDPQRWAVRRPLANGQDGISSPVGVTVSASNQIYVANAGAGAIMKFDSTGRLLRTEICNCEPSGLYPLRDSLYMLSNRTDQIIFLMETRASGERIAFVPALHTNQ